MPHSIEMRVGLVLSLNLRRQEAVKQIGLSQSGKSAARKLHGKSAANVSSRDRVVSAKAMKLR